jgi:hypothetical protein
MIRSASVLDVGEDGTADFTFDRAAIDFNGSNAAAKRDVPPDGDR